MKRTEKGCFPSYEFGRRETEHLEATREFIAIFQDGLMKDLSGGLEKIS